jgi:hypothetical protein
LGAFRRFAWVKLGPAKARRSHGKGGLVELPAPDIELAEKAFKEIADFGNWMQTQPTQSPWFFNVLVSLVAALDREYRSVTVGRRKSLSLLAWGCRNMLELNIWTKYALQSGAQARSLLDDYIVDSIEMFGAFGSWLKFHGGSTDGVESTLTGLHAEAARRDVTRFKHLKMREIAEAVNFTEEYTHVNRVTSKLVHSTGFSVMVLPDQDRLDMLKFVLFESAVRFGVEAGFDIRSYVLRNGVEPLSNQ